MRKSRERVATTPWLNVLQNIGLTRVKSRYDILNNTIMISDEEEGQSSWSVENRTTSSIIRFIFNLHTLTSTLKLNKYQMSYYPFNSPEN